MGFRESKKNYVAKRKFIPTKTFLFTLKMLKTRECLQAHEGFIFKKKKKYFA